MIRSSMIVLMLVATAGCEEIENRSWNVHRRTVGRTAGITDPGDEAVLEVLRRISSGRSTTRDDEELVERVKKIITLTASKIRTPEGSIEGAARRAQYLIPKLTSAYIAAIYKSRSISEAKRNLARFRNTSDEIVNFATRGQFIVQ